MSHFCFLLCQLDQIRSCQAGGKKSERRKEKNEEGRTVNVPVNYCVEDSGVKLSALSLASRRWILYVRGDVTGSRATHSLN